MGKGRETSVGTGREAKGTDAVPERDEDALTEKDSLPTEIRCPGITVEAGTLAGMVEEIDKRLAALRFQSATGAAWVVVLGGTGTGKSTIFNTLCGEPLSETGIERPKTSGAVAYAHEGLGLEEGEVMPGLEVRRAPREGVAGRRFSGEPGTISLVDHRREEMAHLVIVDTPDLDSLERVHRGMAEDLYLLADVVVFVTSQEKYADGIPSRLLRTAQEEEKLIFFILNKAGEGVGVEDVSVAFREHGLDVRKYWSWAFPHVPAFPEDLLAGSEDGPVGDFLRRFFAVLAPKGWWPAVRQQRKHQVRVLRERLDRLLEVLAEEGEASDRWLSRLEELFRESAEGFLQGRQESFAAQSRAFLQSEVRFLFSRYDVLARPRRLVARVVSSPLRWLGLRGGGAAGDLKEQALGRLRERIDLAPVLGALDRFNRRVLEDLSPGDPSRPLHQALRRPGVLITDEEARARIREGQEALLTWLQETFEELSRGIPRRKEWGIYSTFVLWGIFILSLEAAIGGGIGVLDAAVDSLLAPFVTKGTVELFAYREIQRIARDLAGRYRESLLDVLREQRDRYARCLESVRIRDEDLGRVRAARARLERVEIEPPGRRRG